MGDVISFGQERRRRPLPRWLIVAAMLFVVVGAVAFVALRDDGDRPAAAPTGSPTTTTAPAETAVAEPPPGPPCLPVGWGQRPAPTESVAGLDLGAGTGGAIDRCDRTAVDGPWTVVLRQPGGSLGRQGVVVTFPVDPPAPGRQVSVGGVRGVAADRMVTWPLARGYGRVRGDLSDASLIAVAAATKVVDGHPAVSPPAGLAVVASGPYRPPTIHELRYGADEVGERDTLGGALVYTGVTSSGGFEDQLFASDSTDAGPVDGYPAVVSSVSGGNATLAWEPAPGVVVYVGYSGPELNDATFVALRRLAARTQILDNAGWQATHPSTSDQTNDPG
ncbi:MAG TPA: hypothetical protein VK659_15495 [Asanoa sp.]|nr:hypothetical protein [Asanoa sp.]